MLNAEIHLHFIRNCQVTQYKLGKHIKVNSKTKDNIDSKQATQLKKQLVFFMTLNMVALQ